MRRSTEWMMMTSTLLLACATAPRAAPTVDRLVLELPDLDGKAVTLADQAGQVVLVDFWATWCKPCKASFPVYEALYRSYRSRGFTVLAVSVDQQDDVVRRFVEAEGISFTILRDPEGAVPERLELTTMPTAIVVGRDGAVRYVHAGFEPKDEAELKAQIEAALEDEGPAPGGLRRRPKGGVSEERRAKEPPKAGPLSPGDAPRGTL